ncbi:MAG: SH3 domain-containing protein, partial [Peptostreptococcaceae bacterium]|nr:SH3 domain-containing protein [Peptostreptococcaceae bacterium]
MLERRIATAMSVTTASLALATTMSFADTKVGTVTASALNIRSGASTSHSIVTKAYKGNKVEILETSNGWYKVKLSNGKIGWGSGQYINISANNNTNSGNTSQESTQTPSTGKKGTVTASALNIRSGASTSHSIVTKAYKGNTVEILESSNGWHKVKLSNGKIGWASGQYINISADNNTNSGNTSQESTQTPATGKKGTVTASALNIRSGASTSHSIVTKAYKGNTVEILESSNGWHKVKLSNGKIGWASAQYISTSGDNTNSGNTSQESTQSPSNNQSNTSSKVQAIVNTAKAQIGKKKAWGAEGPNAFDCSGLTYYIYKQNGITIPRTSREQSNFGTTVSKSNLQPGDLLFFSTDGSGGVSHVGIYVGNGQMVHVSSSKNSVISTSINTSYWQKA